MKFPLLLPMVGPCLTVYTPSETTPLWDVTVMLHLQPHQCYCNHCNSNMSPSYMITYTCQHPVHLCLYDGMRPKVEVIIQ